MHAIMCLPHVEGMPPDGAAEPFEYLDDALAAVVRVQAGLQRALQHPTPYMRWYASPLTAAEQRACATHAEPVRHYTRCWLLLRADLLDMLRAAREDAGHEFYRQPLGGAAEFIAAVANDGVQELDRYHVRCVVQHGQKNAFAQAAPTAAAFLAYAQPPLRVLLHAWFRLLHGLLSEAAVVRGRHRAVSPRDASVRDQLLDALLADVVNLEHNDNGADGSFDEFRNCDDGGSGGGNSDDHNDDDEDDEDDDDGDGGDGGGGSNIGDGSTAFDDPGAFEDPGAYNHDNRQRAVAVPPAWRAAPKRPAGVPAAARWWCCVPGCGQHSGVGDADRWMCPVHRCRQRSEAYLLADGEKVEYRFGNEWRKAVFRSGRAGGSASPTLEAGGGQALPAKGLELRPDTPAAPRALHLRYAVRLLGPGAAPHTVRVANLNSRPFLLGGGRKAEAIDLPAHAVRLPDVHATRARARALAAAPADGTRMIEVRRFQTWEPARLLLGAEEVAIAGDTAALVVPVTHLTGIRKSTSK